MATIKVNNWHEFAEAIQTEGAIVECPVTEWDMNEITPEGVNAMNIRAAEIIGNGLTIKNIFCNDDFLFYNRSYGNSGYTSYQLSDVQFLDCRVKGFINHNYSSNGKGKFLGCKFSGVSTQAYNTYIPRGIFMYPSSASNGLTFDVSPYSKKGCSFNIIAPNSCLFYSAYISTSLYNHFSHINFRGKLLCASSSSPSNSTVYFEDCLVEGNSNGSSITGVNSIFDVNADSLSFYSATNAIVNADKCVSSGGKRVTTEQLHDAAYLQSIDFPIGVD